MLASNKMKFLLKALIISTIFIGIINTKTLAIVKPTNEFYVNDYANLLNEETKKYIINTNLALYKQTGAQIVVVTIPNLEGDSLEDYATKLFREFGIGDKTKNNGVLLLLTLEERQFRVEVGYGLEGTLTDGKTGRIQDEYIIPYLKNDNWNDGIRNGFNAILKEVTNEYNIEIGAEEAIAIEDNDNALAIITPMVSVIMPAISTGIGLSMRTLKRKKKKLALYSGIYISISVIIFYIICKTFLSSSILQTLFLAIMMESFNLFWFFIALYGRSYGGHYGGFSGGSGSSYGGGGFSSGGFSGGGSAGGGGSSRSF